MSTNTKEKRWYIYDRYILINPRKDLWMSGGKIIAISEIKLPPRIDTHFCAIHYHLSTTGNLKIGQVNDLVLGDPRLLKKCKLIAKDVAQLPQTIKVKFGDKMFATWWTFLWKGKLIFMDLNEVALARDTKRQFW